MTIFLRSFLTFWIATVLIISISFGLVLMTHHLNRVPPVSLPLPELQACLAKTLEARNAGRFIQTAKQCRLVYILGPSRTELLASREDTVARSLAAGVTPMTPVKLDPFRNEVMVAFDAPINNAHFVAVARLPGRANGPPPLLWWQFVVAAVVSAATCFVLTRHFIDPIRKLQRSTESFGQGNLGSRPDVSLLDRRDELGDLSRTIGQMSTRISTLLSSQKNFLIQVSHELGSPLSRLNVALALARRKANPALLPELNRIQADSSELNSMIQQLLRLARLESGLEQEEEEEVYSLDELLQQVCLDNQFTAEQTSKRVHLLSSPPINMRGYRELLKRALDNILRNAIRFTPEGGRVEVDVLSRSDDTVVIQVKDSGTGVQDDKLDAIFEPFVRASSDRSGAGLGLAIARQAVHANRGTIRALNRVEGGLLIEVSLPYASNGLTESALR